MSGLWKYFNRVMENPKEKFSYSIYQPITEFSRTGVETIVAYIRLHHSPNGLWMYPEEESVLQFEGREYSVDGIFFFQSDAVIRYGSVISAAVNDFRLYRCGAINNLKSHYEISVFSPEISMEGVLKIHTTKGTSCITLTEAE